MRKTKKSSSTTSDSEYCQQQQPGFTAAAEEQTTSPPPKLDDGFYEIERIRRKRIRKVFYLFIHSYPFLTLSLLLITNSTMNVANLG